MTYADMIDYIEGSIDVIVQVGRHEGDRGITEFYLPGSRRRRMMTFEYRTLTFDTHKMKEKGMEKSLNALGNEGWELVGVASPEFSTVRAFLKRSKSMEGVTS